MYSSGPAFAGILFEEGNEVQKHIAKIAVEKQWGSTMVLTEPDAGSDVGAGRTKAVQQEDGSWHIEGVKRFITSGEHDMSENILHYVLARPRAPAPAPRACPSSSSRSTSSTSRPASWASATASTPPTSSTRWA